MMDGNPIELRESRMEHTLCLTLDSSQPYTTFPFELGFQYFLTDGELFGLAFEF